MVPNSIQDYLLRLHHLFLAFLQLICTLRYYHYIIYIGFQTIFIQQGEHPRFPDDKVGSSLQPIMISKPSSCHLWIWTKISLFPLARLLNLLFALPFGARNFTCSNCQLQLEIWISRPETLWEKFPSVCALSLPPSADSALSNLLQNSSAPIVA